MILKEPQFVSLAILPSAACCSFVTLDSVVLGGRFAYQKMKMLRVTVNPNSTPP